MAEVVTQDENPTRRKTLQERLTTLIESNMRNANITQNVIFSRQKPSVNDFGQVEHIMKTIFG